LVTRKSKRERPVGGRSGPGSEGSTIQEAPPLFATVEIRAGGSATGTVAEDLAAS
jgi:hypothetical protein